MKSHKVDPRLAILRLSASDNEVLVSGTADLLDGTRLRCGVWQGNWDGPFDGLMYKDTRVVDLRFECRFDLRTPWSSTISASVALTADRNQPEDVQARIGSRGERLAFTDADDCGSAVVVTTTSLAPP